ncbi:MULTISPECIES: hypothetical protein [Streptomycetaceae]|uniref:Uncharacterized protein n=1 Tax=Streptantibioticus cattleyicolor (strain ATCC 35852 / DSM 46488 / JCM 4925 / NBRC 14057 / NRRL 8057) TaxID=1003195 RepID=F8JXC3_STREN|nr:MULTISPECIES: hypothetical protein [Streptomycetaceae]AEW94596.1 hypothetical protein SCATT_22250 [Streptantibioticus cattleyicolor NRRL 8057 = DSM 46488]MYS59234.1 hypothetical protein [Streptomyces sp. SID5468]CCB74953.1 protein of unknown function [Streptantibioticus cattleyicolor NRRL 8057 = DSM 46488]
MPAFTYTGDEGRYYPRLGLTPEPGRAYDLEEDPDDGRWQAAPVKTTKKAGVAPEKEVGDAEA